MGNCQESVEQSPNRISVCSPLAVAKDKEFRSIKRDNLEVPSAQNSNTRHHSTLWLDKNNSSEYPIQSQAITPVRDPFCTVAREMTGGYGRESLSATVITNLHSEIQKLQQELKMRDEKHHEQINFLLDNIAKLQKDKYEMNLKSRKEITLSKMKGLRENSDVEIESEMKKEGPKNKVLMSQDQIRNLQPASDMLSDCWVNIDGQDEDENHVDLDNVVMKTNNKQVGGEGKSEYRHDTVRLDDSPDLLNASKKLNFESTTINNDIFLPNHIGMSLPNFEDVFAYMKSPEKINIEDVDAMQHSQKVAKVEEHQYNQLDIFCSIDYHQKFNKIPQIPIINSEPQDTLSDQTLDDGIAADQMDEKDNLSGECFSPQSGDYFSPLSNDSFTGIDYCTGDNEHHLLHNRQQAYSGHGKERCSMPKCEGTVSLPNAIHIEGRQVSITSSEACCSPLDPEYDNDQLFNDLINRN